MGASFAAINLEVGLAVLAAVVTTLEAASTVITRCEVEASANAPTKTWTSAMKPARPGSPRPAIPPIM